jgi:hypothetical protein
MRLDFNVLWVEDQERAVRAQCEQIASKIRKQGFRLNALFAPSIAEASKYIGDEIYVDHVDLILMDYDLGKGPRGDEGLVKVREVMPYKEIIFYSAQADNLRQILQKADVDGVHVSSREGLTDYAVGIFEILVKKVIDIEHSRGIVMGATSEIDHVINDCLVAFFDKCKKEDQAKILTEVTSRISKIKQRYDAELAELAAIKHVSELKSMHAVYTSADRLKLLRSVFEVLKIHADKKPMLVGYAEKVMPRRNDLAHVRVHVSGFARKLLDRNSVELTAEDMRLLRVQILESRELFEELQNSVKA